MSKRERDDLLFTKATDVQDLMHEIVEKLKIRHIRVDRVFCVRSTGSRARAYARIWGLSRIFQEVAGFQPTYVIEVLSEKFDTLSLEQKRKVIIHELMHIPKTFSGALLSHRGRHHRINNKEINALYKRIYT